MSGVQFDVTYDNTVMSLSAALSSADQNSGKSAYYSDVTPNLKRFLIVGGNQTSLPDGLLLNLLVNVSSTAPNGSYALTLSNTVASDPNGQPVTLSGASGSVTIQSGSSSSVQLVNAGSFVGGSVAPGELVTFFGSGIGPASAATPTAGTATSTALAGISVMFGGTAAPLLYAGPNQINAIAPFEISGGTSTLVSIANSSGTATQMTVPVVAAAPGMFTSNGSGTGQGAILNQDTSINSAANPAARGSIVVLYANGAGQTNPGGVDGQVSAAPLPVPVLPVTVTIGGAAAQVLYAGPAPGLVAGVLQVNCRVPATINPGSAVSVIVTVGTVSSQPGVTLAVQ